MKLIAIVGKKRSGKDTTADYIINKNGMKHQLAGPIKDALVYGWHHSVTVDHANILTSKDWEGKGFDREKTLIINNVEANKVLTHAMEYCQKMCARFRHPTAPPYYDIEKIIENITLNNIEPWTMRRFMQTLGTDIVCTHIDDMYWIKIFANVYIDNLHSGRDYFVVPDVRQQNELDTLRAMGATIIHVVRPETDQVNKDTHITERGLEPAPGDTIIVNDGSLEELYEKINKVI